MGSVSNLHMTKEVAFAKLAQMASKYPMDESSGKLFSTMFESVMSMFKDEDTSIKESTQYLDKWVSIDTPFNTSIEEEYNPNAAIYLELDSTKEKDDGKPFDIILVPKDQDGNILKETIAKCSKTSAGLIVLDSTILKKLAETQEKDSRKIASYSISVRKSDDTVNIKPLKHVSSLVKQQNVKSAGKWLLQLDGSKQGINPSNIIKVFPSQHLSKNNKNNAV